MTWLIIDGELGMDALARNVVHSCLYQLRQLATPHWRLLYNDCRIQNVDYCNAVLYGTARQQQSLVGCRWCWTLSPVWSSMLASTSTWRQCFVVCFTGYQYHFIDYCIKWLSLRSTVCNVTVSHIHKLSFKIPMKTAMFRNVSAFYVKLLDVWGANSNTASCACTIAGWMCLGSYTMMDRDSIIELVTIL